MLVYLLRKFFCTPRPDLILPTVVTGEINMPNFDILRFAKLKGSSVSSSASHGGRTRDTPNADPERRELNELLLGEDRELREMLEERIREEGIWRRANSVELLEIMVTATRAHFEDERGNLVEARVREWERANVKWLEEKFGLLILKLESHRDEWTPHLTGYIIPVHDGALNARHFIGSRGKLSKLQDEYGKAMEPLGLVRGEKGSRATHQDIGRFYGTIMRPVNLEVDRKRIPLPGRLDLLTERGREAYREEVIKATLEQVEAQVETLRNQALLTLTETRKREAAEERAAKKVEAAERAARAAQDALDKAQDALEREQEQNVALTQQNAQFREMIMSLHRQAKEFEREAKTVGKRVTDIPLVEVMAARGHRGEREGEAMIYPARGRCVALSVSENKLYSQQGRFMGEHSVDVTILLHKVEREEDLTERQALGWLAEKFGEPRALAAYVLWIESGAQKHLEQTRPERLERMRPPRVIQRAEPERILPARLRDDNSTPSRGTSR
jgi:hypothetical protein